MIIAIIQARIGSTRLPGKTMADIGGKPMLWHVVNRTRWAKKVDETVIATSDKKENIRILELAAEMGIKSYAGSEEDVLDRYYQAAKNHKADVIVRITGDCPFIDPRIIDNTIEYFLNNNFDYISTAHISKKMIKSSYPDGLDTEVFSFNALEKAWKEAKLNSEREHVTPYIWKNPKIFKVKVQNRESNQYLSNMHWGVEEGPDLKFVREVYKRLYPIKKMFYMEDILDLLKERPELMNINKEIERDEGYFKSLEEDKINKDKVEEPIGKAEISVNCRGLKIPLCNRIVNLGLFSYKRTSILIDKLKSLEREWAKVKILVNDPEYITFLQRITEKKNKEIIGYLNDFYRNKKFKDIFSEKLAILDKTEGDWGDVRFHSLSLYVVVRGIEPDIMVETGVASGKSTALILLAMDHNRKGKLVSIDLPNVSGRVLEDGAKTSTHEREIGWLIPEYLKKRWDLEIGDSLEVLPKMVDSLKKIDIFFHDSLHTYPHVKKELAIIKPKMRGKGVVLCDNINLGAGKAFNEFLENNNLVGYAYRDFGGVSII